MVTVKNLTVLLQKQKILKDITCSLFANRITLFIGESGAGKTTLLKSIAGLIPCTKGTITVNNKELRSLSPQERCKKIGYVFQDFNLFANLTVLRNCIDPMIVQGIAPDQAQQQAHELLQQLGIAEHASKYPSELSGGQQQRVAIARALCLQPTLLLLDEPTASLDPLSTANLVIILKQLAAQGIALGISSHDMDFVRALFDCVYYIQKGTIKEYCEGKQMLARCATIQKHIK